jgi:hypothetical protein
MNIRKLHHYHHKFIFLKAWYFLIPAIIFATLAVQGLRANYSKMVELREAVYVADQQNGDVEGALAALRAHVHGHMNTNLVSGKNAIRPPIQLKARYDRLMAGEAERVKAQNAEVTRTAEQICAQSYPAGGFNAPRVACIQDYVSTHAVKTNSIPDQLYKFDFVSPGWSFDLAGISIILCCIFTILFFARLLLEYYLRRRLA